MTKLVIEQFQEPKLWSNSFGHWHCGDENIGNWTILANIVEVGKKFVTEINFLTKSGRNLSKAMLLKLVLCNWNHIYFTKNGCKGGYV